MSKFVSAMQNWTGRVDSTDDYEAFRWHQIVKKIDIDELKPFDGGLGFAFIGFCSDLGVERNRGRIGTAAAPDFIRRQMSNMPCTFAQEVSLFDAGNIICEDITLEEAQKQLSEAVACVLSANLFPIVLGGGHGTAFGHYMGLKKHYGSREIGIINFDAHFDIRPYDNGNTSGTMFRQIADICIDEGHPFNYMPIGIQRHSNTISLFKTAEHLGADYILAKDIQTGSFANIMERIDDFLFNQEKLYMTICADVFSSAFAPGVSATQSIGLDPEIVLPMIKHILKQGKTAGFDICEVSPRFDQDNTTANLAAVIIFSVVDTICDLQGLGIDS